mgnify:CR=1 FL=1
MSQMTAADLVQHLSDTGFPSAFVAENADALRKALPPNRQVLITSLPKTGSTLLFRALAVAIGRPINLVTYSTDGNEQELYFPALLHAVLHKPGLCRLHMRATRPNLALIHALHLTPIVLVRDLFDIIVSQRDHITRKLYGTMGQVTAEHADPLHERFRTLSDEEQFDQLIDLNLPWLLEFYRSWHDAAAAGQVPVMWLNYSEIHADKAGALTKCAT